MENLFNKFDEIIYEIKNSNDYKNYVILHKMMIDNEEINKLISEIKDLQKVIVNKEYKKVDFFKEEEQLNENLNKLNSIPLYVEYDKYQKKLDDQFQLLKEKINNYIENI